MDGTPWMGWLVVGLLGLPMALGLVALLFRQPVDVDSFLVQVGKLIENGRLDRAIRLCTSTRASRMVVCKVAGAILISQVPLLDEERGATGYRQQGQQRPYARRLREGVAPAIENARARVKRAMLLALLGLVPLPVLYLMGASFHQRPSVAQLVASALLATLAVAGLAKGGANLTAIAKTIDALIAMKEELHERERRGDFVA